MFFKSIDKPHSGAFVDGCPLIKALSVPLCSTFKTVAGHFLNIHTIQETVFVLKNRTEKAASGTSSDKSVPEVASLCKR